MSHVRHLPARGHSPPQARMVGVERTSLGGPAKQCRITTEGGARGALEGAYFVDRRGKIVTPPLSPHLPLAYSASTRCLSG